MAIAHVGSTVHNEAAPTTSCTVTIHASTATGHILLLAAVNRNGTADLSVTDDDTGGNTWQLLKKQIANTSRSVQVWWKRATSGTASKTVTVSGATNSVSAGCAVFSGVHPGSTPYEAATGEDNVSADETQAGITISDNAMLIFVIGNVLNDLTPTTMASANFGSLAESFNALSTGGSHCGTNLSYDLVTTGGATGNLTWAQTDNLTGTIVFALLPDINLVPAAGTLVISGQSPKLEFLLTAANGNLAITGLAPSVSISGGGTNLEPGTGALTLTGLAPALEFMITVPGGSIVITGLAPTLDMDIGLSPGTGALAITGLAPSLGFLLTAGTGALTLTGYAAALELRLTPAGDELVLTGLAPTVDLPADHFREPATAVLTVTGLAPTAQQLVARLPDAAALTLTGLAPTLDQTEDVSLSPDADALLLTGLAPSIQIANVIIPGTGALVLTGLAPALTQTDDINLSPDPDELVLTGHAPVVQAPLEQRGGGSDRRKRKPRKVYTLPNGTRVVTDAETYRRLIAPVTAVQAGPEIAAKRAETTTSEAVFDLPAQKTAPKAPDASHKAVDPDQYAGVASLPAAVAEAYVAAPGLAAAAAARRQREETAAAEARQREIAAAKAAADAKDEDDLLMLLLMAA